MKLRIVILLLIFNLGSGCSCDCDKVPKYFDVNGMNTKVFQLEKRYGNQDESEYLLNSVRQVSYDKLIITLIPNVTYYDRVSMFKTSLLLVPYTPVVAVMICRVQEVLLNRYLKSTS